MKIQDFKKQFNQNSKYIHLNNSGQAPIPENNRKKIKEWSDRLYYEGAFCSNEGWSEVEKTRKILADFVGADAEEVSFFQTTASALSQVALSLRLNEGDEILSWDQEYPSNFYPWRQAAEKAGAKLIQIKSEDYETPYENILKHVTPKTKVIAISWVQYQTGAVTDLAALSKQLKGKNIWLVADVIQGLGVRPFNFHESGFDVVCCGSHKWMCSSYGAAFMIIRKDKIEELQPREYGAMTFGGPDTAKSFSNKPKKTAQKFEPGSKAMIEIVAMAESIALFQKFGIISIFDEANRMANRLRIGLLDLNLKVFLPHDGPIINFTSGENKKDLVIANVLAENKISYAQRGPGIRLSVHAFNLDEEIDKALMVVRHAIDQNP